MQSQDSLDFPDYRDAPLAPEPEDRITVSHRGEMLGSLTYTGVHGALAALRLDHAAAHWSAGQWVFKVLQEAQRRMGNGAGEDRSQVLVSAIRERLAFYREERGRLVTEGAIDPSGPNVVDDLAALLRMLDPSRG